MDKLKTYRTIIKEVLTRYYELDLSQPSPGIEPVLALDDVREHYFWALFGWNQNQRTCGSTVYIRIKDGKVWVEEDLTEDGVTNNLLEAGIPKHDIVLGFQHPFLAGFN
ncbi:MAG: XisI protein [Calothrix sp. SM1_7_51]|nr:XisI protein [Calothrix sp. SM1_7_51]